MLTPDDPLLLIWRAQPANRRFTDEAITHAIGDAYATIDNRANRTMTSGARDLAASYQLRMTLTPKHERELLSDLVDLLLGVDA